MSAPSIRPGTAPPVSVGGSCRGRGDRQLRGEAKPGGLTALSSPPRVGLTWIDQSSNEDGFCLYRSEDGGPYLFAGNRSANAGSHLDTKVRTGRAYRYIVSTFNAWGKSDAGPVGPASP